MSTYFPIRLGGFLLAVVLFAGCAGMREPADVPAPELPAGFPNHTADEIRAFMTESGAGLRAFDAKTSLSIQSPEQDGRFTGDLRTRRGDSLYMTLSPGLGIDAARVLVTPDSIFLYNRIDNEILYGSIEDAGNLMALPADSETLFENLLGIAAPEPGIQWTVRADGSLYVLTDPSGTRIYTIDPAYWRVVRYVEQTGSGQILEEREFSDFDNFDGVFLARRVSFERPADQTRASIYYRSIEINPPTQSFVLRTSSSATRRPVG